MKNIRNNIPVILLTLFEFAVGVLLLINPEAFTKAVLIIFGAILIVIGAIYLVRVLRDKTEGVSGITMTVALISLIVGILCIVFPSMIMSLFSVAAIIYGVMLIVSGVYKTKSYTDAKKAGSPLPVISLISAFLSVALGILIVLNPFGTVRALFTFAAIFLIIEAALDLVSVILNTSGGKKQDVIEASETKELEEK